jgi:DUF971 family protein
MSDKHPLPTDIVLNQKDKILRVTFEGDTLFELSCEYLRVFSPSAENLIAQEDGTWLTGKGDVNIKQIDPIGNYAVRLTFDDGHKTGVYSWQWLYELGVYEKEKWAEYQKHI